MDPITLALGAAAIAAAASSSGPPESVRRDVSTDASSGSTPVPVSVQTTAVPLRDGAQSWRDELAEYQCPLSLDALLRWVQIESDGDPSAVGSLAQLRRDGWARESGIGQLYFDTRATRIYGVTTDELRVACSPTAQTLLRMLSIDERAMHTSSLVGMATDYRARISSVLGADWGDDDGACGAKLFHALPIMVTMFLARLQSDSWSAFRDSILSMSQSDSTAVLSAYGGSGYISYAMDGTTYVGWSRYLSNAQRTGIGYYP